MCLERALDPIDCSPISMKCVQLASRAPLFLAILLCHETATLPEKISSSLQLPVAGIQGSVCGPLPIFTLTSLVSSLSL